MVQKHRASHKATDAKDVSPMRSTGLNKYAVYSSSPSGGFQLGNRLAAPAATSSNSAATAANKWQYNNMVSNNRDQFNNLHFC